MFFVFYGTLALALIDSLNFLHVLQKLLPKTCPGQDLQADPHIPEKSKLLLDTIWQSITCFSADWETERKLISERTTFKNLQIQWCVFTIPLRREFTWWTSRSGRWLSWLSSTWPHTSPALAPSLRKTHTSSCGCLGDGCLGTASFLGEESDSNTLYPKYSVSEWKCCFDAQSWRDQKQ